MQKKSKERDKRKRNKILSNLKENEIKNIFDNIKLVGQKTDSYMMGKPLIMTK